QMPLRAVLESKGSDVGDGALGVEPGVERSGARIEERARHRPDRAAREVAIRRQRELADALEIGALELALPRNPLAPRARERHAVDLRELPRVIGLAAGPS